MCEWEQEPVEVKARESEDNRGLSLRVAGGIGNIGEKATVAARTLAAMGVSSWNLYFYDLFPQFGGSLLSFNFLFPFAFFQLEPAAEILEQR